MAQDIVDTAKGQVIAYNNKNWAAVTQALGSRAMYDEVGTNRKFTGAEHIIDAWKAWAAAFPDSRATFDAVHVAGATVILELTWRGTHRGPLHTPTGQIPATGKPIDIRACQIVEVKDDKVQRIHHYFDMVTLLAQLGVSPAAA